MDEIVRTCDFDPFGLDLPEPSELDALVEMQAAGRAALYEWDGSWLVVESLGSGAIGIPFARGGMASMRSLFDAVLQDCELSDINLCWVRGRPGWERALKDQAVKVEIHSVCYKIQKRELH